MLASTNRQLIEQFEARGVRAKAISFRETSVGMAYSFGLESGVIPIAQTFSENSKDESEFRPTYRLVVFPSDFKSYEAAQGYEIRWDIVDATDNRIVWGTRSNGSRVVWYSQDEAAEERAKQIVDGFIAELTRAGAL